MSEKDFRRFMLIFLGNFVIIGILVTLLILGANGILPDIFRKIGLILLIAGGSYLRQGHRQNGKKSRVFLEKEENPLQIT